ncbi:MAG TPA: TMEM175 family protein [Polyangia bacterium]|nr:TMEM175 family protein [Polyangia bacterium]
MGKARLEAFSDGVIAIIITIMVLELKTPEHATWAALCERWPILLSYVLSFFFVGVYWGNHHHLLHTLLRVDGKILWLNLHLLFWMSLIPFMTRWLGETYPAPAPTVAYGAVMLVCGVAYSLLQRAIAAQQTEEARRRAHRHQTRKAAFAIALYSSAMVLAWYGHVLVAVGLYVVVALSWTIPDRGLERVAAAE